MEPVAVIIFTFFTLMGIGGEIERLEMTAIQQQATLALLDAEIVDLQEDKEKIKEAYSELADQYNGLHEDYLKLGSSHASVAARDLVNHENQKEEIERVLKEIQSLQGKTDYLDDKIQLLHP